VKHRNKTKMSQNGFTIVELAIATSVFSVVLIGALAGFMQVGRLFYKGISITSTNDVSIQILNDLQESVQTASSVSSAMSKNGFNYMCIGNVRYTYAIGTKINSSITNEFSDGQGYGLVRDTLPGGSACAAPCPANGACNSPDLRWQQPVEMLGNKMRLGAFSVTQNAAVSPNYYDVALSVIYGDDETLSYKTAGNYSTAYCTGGSTGNEFCAVSSFNTGFTRGVSL
jgi:prepilin-type N-terminal cleavage/methylation domain-containing protein